ncbi:VanY-A/VanY-F/VanY-M family D-Ala-D-Ala carboxypeptidase [Paenibacillus sp. FA6]|uniref:VanY-A/VanY-F/VanY-M family D-Ala-D-Ala carboxypeptidase n=1 Tax=Paenibacillus sp. FA6 TaxID=3413029 RepID=UPI003F65EE95
MKKWVFLVIIILLLGIKAINIASDTQKTDEVSNEDHEIQGGTLQSTLTIDVTQDQVYQGDLLLVNKEYPVREDSVKSDIVSLFGQKDLVQGYGLLDSNIELSKRVTQKFLKMVEAAEKDGVNHFLINSGYRDFDKQNRIYQEMGSDYALPAGYSEHNLGLSLDIGSTQMEMSKAPEGKWLQENAWKYGFILRYPKDKTAITGIQYEPWHFRYVGLPHSAIMQKNNDTLEQYLDFLKERGSISMIIEGKEYDVSYHSVSRNTSIEIPANRHYEASGNNIDGVIVTVYE